MKGYMIHFLVYSLAMVGFFGVCLYIYKNLCIKGLAGNKNDFLTVENGIRINPRKQILIVRAGNERFLIASDYDRTTMLAKLNSENEKTNDNENISNISNISDITENYLESNRVLEFKSMQEEDIPPVLKRINEKMKG